MIKIGIIAYVESIEEKILKKTPKRPLKREIDEVRSKKEADCAQLMFLINDLYPIFIWRICIITAFAT